MTSPPGFRIWGHLQRNKVPGLMTNHYEERLEAMLAVDEMVGSLVDELEAAGELENTYIFFTSDNG